jgi:hypothetical protein
VRGLGLGANVRASVAPVLMGIAHKRQCVEAPTQVGNPFVWPTKVDHCERKWCTMHTKTLQLSLTWNVCHSGHWLCTTHSLLETTAWSCAVASFEVWPANLSWSCYREESGSKRARLFTRPDTTHGTLILQRNSQRATATARAREPCGLACSEFGAASLP